MSILVEEARHLLTMMKWIRRSWVLPTVGAVGEKSRSAKVRGVGCGVVC